MKIYLTIIMLLICIISFGQIPSNENLIKAKEEWVYYSNGNPIDGYKRASIRLNDGAHSDNFYILSIENHAESLKLEDRMGGESENDRDDLVIDLRAVSKHSFSELKELFMYFDNDKFYFKVNYRAYNKNGLLWWCAVENNDTKFLDRFDFVNKLKLKSNVTFRFVFSDGQYENVTFTLKGSKITLDKTVDLSNFNYEKDEGFKMHSIIGALRLINIENADELKKDLSDLNISKDDFYNKLFDYLKEKLGQYYLALISNVQYLDNLLYFSNFNDKVILKINIKEDL